MSDRMDLRTLPHLVGDVFSQFSKLFVNEIDLAKVELKEKATKLGGAIGMLGAGAILLIPALTMALFALAALLQSYGWSQAASCFISAVVAALLSAVFFMVGMHRLDPEELAPQETANELKKDKDLIKGIVR